MTDHPDRPPSGGRIVDSAVYGEHIPLTCDNHPHLRWYTKNIAPIGTRGIFFAGSTERGERKQPFHGLLNWKFDLEARMRGLNPYALANGYEEVLDEGDLEPINSFEALERWVEWRRYVLDNYAVECDCPVADLIPLEWLEVD